MYIQESALRQVHAPNRNSHLNSQKQSSNPREQTNNQKQSAKKFQHARDISKVARESHMPKSIQPLSSMPKQFRITMKNKNSGKSQPQKKQRHRLQFLKKRHSITSESKKPRQ